jgi:predicted double-glycine peptidase
MKNFRLLTRTRQATEYSCGACALQAVLSYWGKEVDEEDLMKRLHTTSEVGTYPEDIVRVARALGLEAEAKQNLTLDEVAQFTAGGNPMIALAQVWRSQRESAPSVAEGWDSGHYVVVLGVDEKYVYFQDPYVRMSKAFTPRKTFEDHWHQVMGGDLAKNPKLTHLGVFIRGAAPTRPEDDRQHRSSSLDFKKFGSMNLITVEFSDVILPFDLLTELKKIIDGASVRPDAFIFLRKDENGLSAIEGSGLQEEEDTVEINALVAALASQSIGTPELLRSKVMSAVEAATGGDFGISAADIERIAGRLRPGCSAMVVLFENVWERRFKEIAHRYGGTISNRRIVTPEALGAAANAILAE